MKIILSPDPVSINPSGFAKVSLQDAEGNPFRLGFTNAHILKFPPPPSENNYYRFPIVVDAKQKDHLNMIYHKIQSTNNWFLKTDIVDWKPIGTAEEPNSLLVKWPW